MYVLLLKHVNPNSFFSRSYEKNLKKRKRYFQYFNVEQNVAFSLKVTVYTQVYELKKITPKRRVQNLLF
jgi:hypothetical protein